MKKLILLFAFVGFATTIAFAQRVLSVHESGETVKARYEAMASIYQALVFDPNNAEYLLRYGYLKEESGDIEGALEEYKKAVKANPEFFEAQYYTGAIYLDKVIKILAEVNNLSDQEWEQKSESMSKEANRLYSEAIPYFTKASDLQPENTDIMNILFAIHTKLKNDEEAQKYNQRISAILGADWMERNN
jgi:tetratricopeptide (TPR) repeat protein